MFSSITKALAFPKRQIPDHLKKRIRLHYGPVMDLAGASGQGLMILLTPKMRWSGPLAGQILEVAGPALKEQADMVISRPKPGQVYDFPGFGSGFDKIYIGILPVWDDGVLFEDRELVSCYRDTLKKAKAAGLGALVFPALGKDKTDFPHVKFARLAMKGIFKELGDPLMHITIACADKRMMEVYKKRLES